MLEKKGKTFTKIINYLTFKKRKQNKKTKHFFIQNKLQREYKPE